MMSKKMTQSVRVISGKLRRRKIYFPNISTVRPTQDRIRETLFSWLSFDITNSCCLDLFSGSGVLGFESLSRGAKHVTFVDQNRDAIAAIKENVKEFELSNVDIHRATVPALDVSFFKTRYDIVFLDPPFNQQLHVPTLFWLIEERLIDQDSLVYFEMNKMNRALLDKINPIILKEKSTKTISYGLFKIQ